MGEVTVASSKKGALHMHMYLTSRQVLDSVDLTHSTDCVTSTFHSSLCHLATATSFLFLSFLQVSSVDCSPSNSLRAVSSGTDRCIKVWDLNKGFCVRTIICHSSCNSVRCTRDEHIICSGHFDGTLRFWDIRSGKMANEVTGLHTQQICSIQIGTRNGVFIMHAWVAI